MRRASVILILTALGACAKQQGGPSSTPPRFGFGRPATPEEIQAWDIAVSPDGRGLPPGRGTARQGMTVYQHQCAGCHGASGTEGPAERLVGRAPRTGFPFGRDPSLGRTIGNYWPYATTLYDYIHRAMPLNAPGSLQPDEVYSLVAYLLWRNEIVADTAVIDAQSLPRIVMPAHARFVLDNRRGGREIR